MHIKHVVYGQSTRPSCLYRSNFSNHLFTMFNKPEV